MDSFWSAFSTSFWISVILTAILFGIAASMAAKRKGREETLWFILGVLLGPFGMIYALLLEDRKRPMATCPYCYGEINPKATVCKHCTSDLSSNRPLVSSWTPSTETNQDHSDLTARKRDIICPSCKQSESIAEAQLFAVNLYTKFDAHVKSSFGFQTLHLRCRHCKTDFTLEHK